MSSLLDVRIQGESMWPTFQDGQTLTFRTLDDTMTLSEGEVVLVRHPLKEGVVMVKRIARIEQDGRLFLLGDHPDPLASEDSHNFGPVSPDSVQAKWTG
ncbi:MAG: nickel-type superoxide dismutase maturation protease [Poseidonia sp.]